MVQTTFTPLASFLGGMMIGTSAVLLMLASGRIAGISGIVSRLLTVRIDAAWLGRLAFVGGLVCAPLLVAPFTGTATVSIAVGTGVLAVAGLLVGFGAVYGNGCTSGHGVCGLSRLSLRSLIATGIFMTTAVLTVYLVRHGA